MMQAQSGRKPRPRLGCACMVAQTAQGAQLRMLAAVHAHSSCCSLHARCASVGTFSVGARPFRHALTAEAIIMMAAHRAHRVCTSALQGWPSQGTLSWCRRSAVW